MLKKSWLQKIYIYICSVFKNNNNGECDTTDVALCEYIYLG